tara:strand:+ start:186 stop:464 length:279 start_codon:yes stop_codon:yes gene_type:complete
MIDCMLDADKRLQEGYEELRAVGSNYYCEELLQFLPLNSTPTILNLFTAINESEVNNTVKVFALEGLASGLAEIAMELGFIGGKNEQTNTKD